MTHPLKSGQHPLTEEICDALWDEHGRLVLQYYLLYEEVRLTCRAAADWQLEADAEWWRIILNKAEFLPPHAVNYIVEEFKQSMRPQEES